MHMTSIAGRLLLSIGALVVTMASRGVAQSVIPKRVLTPPSAATVLPFDAIDGVRALANGAVLVNDSRNRQLIALDSSFMSMTTMLDSTESAVHYGPGAARLIPYLADSTLFLGANSQFLFLIDPSGFVAHRFVKTAPGQTPMPLPAPRGFDAEGNAIVAGMPGVIRTPSGRMTFSSETPVLRANFGTRTYDPIASVQLTNLEQVQMSEERGVRRMKRTINPLVVADDWTVLSNGTVAVIRVRDYRVDLIQPNGRKVSSTKLPFAKRRLTDDDKRRLVDSARAAVATAGRSTRVKFSEAALARMDSIRKHARGRPGGSTGEAFTLQINDDSGQFAEPAVAFLPLKEMPDFLPPFLAGATTADLDANLWILTTAVGTSPGETIYDVVNSRGELFQKVRVPAGRVIAGFGHGGIVYLKVRLETNRWGLERVSVVN